jgi:hypothetical protein
MTVGMCTDALAPSGPFAGRKAEHVEGQRNARLLELELRHRQVDEHARRVELAAQDAAVVRIEDDARLEREASRKARADAHVVHERRCCVRRIAQEVVEARDEHGVTRDGGKGRRGVLGLGRDRDERARGLGQQAVERARAGRRLGRAARAQDDESLALRAEVIGEPPARRVVLHGLADREVAQHGLRVDLPFASSASSRRGGPTSCRGDGAGSRRLRGAHRR